MSERDDFHDLDDLQPDWVEADDTLGNPVPDGIYQARIEKVELTRTKNFGKPMVHWELEILGPTHAGHRLFDNQVISGGDEETRRQKLSFIKSRLHLLGCDIANPRQLADDNLRASLLDICVEVRQKTTTKGDESYVNLYFTKRLDLEAQGSTKKRRF